MEYKVVIQGCFYGKNRTFPDMNNMLAAHNRHYQEGAKMKRDYQMICTYAIRKYLRGVKIEKPIRITYTFHEVDRRRDLGNLGGFTDKCFEDALQVCKVIENDNQKFVKEIHFLLGEPDKANPRIEVKMEEIE